jgi:ligand-binding sensor domain-containing protein
MKKIYFLYFFLFYCIYATTQSNSAPLRFQKITTEQGLPHNYVHSVTQDKKGFIWIGTNYGLARFDGYNYKVFLPNQNKPNSITHKPIGLVYADSKERLWLSINSGGINKMDLETERFTGYFADSTNKHLIGVELRFYNEDKESNIWIATNNGIFLYSEPNDKFIYALSKKKFKAKNNYINSLADDNNGHIWFINDNKAGILNKKNLDIITDN